MVRKQRSIWILAAGVLLVVLATTESSYAWFNSDAAAVKQLSAGNISIALDYNPVVSEGQSQWTLHNQSSSSIYVRLGYTFAYKNAQGQQLMQDVSGVSLSDHQLLAGGDSVPSQLIAVAQDSSGSPWDKRFLIPCDRENPELYYKLPPGQPLSGVCTVVDMDADADQTLCIQWTAEAIQVSSKALQDAKSYGWEAERMG